MQKGLHLAIVFLIVLTTSCVRAPVSKKSETVITTEDHIDLSDQLNAALQHRYTGWKSPRVGQILNGFVSRIIAAQEDDDKLKIRSSQIILLETDQHLVQAGIRGVIYISRGALRSVRFENELVFLLAREVSVLRANVIDVKLSTKERAEVLVSSGWFNENGLFDIGENANIAADREGVRFIYKCRYDPRGAVSMLTRWSVHQKLVRPVTTLILPKAEERLLAVRQEIAKLSPVRDPIVNSPLFDELLIAVSKKGSKDARRSAVN